jgi:hypothetical protein
MAFVPRLALSTRFAPRAIVPIASTFVRPSVACIGSRYFHSTKMASHPIATLDVRIEDISRQNFWGRLLSQAGQYSFSNFRLKTLRVVVGD